MTLPGPVRFSQFFFSTDFATPSRVLPEAVWRRPSGGGATVGDAHDCDAGGRAAGQGRCKAMHAAPQSGRRQIWPAVVGKEFFQQFAIRVNAECHRHLGLPAVLRPAAARGRVRATDRAPEEMQTGSAIESPVMKRPL